MCGVKTNIVTAALATTHESADTKQLPHLLGRTAETFTIDEVSADKAYSSKRNLREIEAVGATPYIPFKSYSKGSQGKGQYRFDSLWAKMWHFYNYNREEFNAHYHKRSNVETTMAMIQDQVWKQREIQVRDGSGQRGPVQGSVPQYLRPDPVVLRARHRS